MYRGIIILLLAIVLLSVVPSTMVIGSTSKVFNPPPKPGMVAYDNAPNEQMLRKSRVVSTSGYWSWQDYPFPLPDVEPIKVPVFVNLELANSSYTPFTAVVKVPEGEWSKILLRIDAKLYDPVFGRPVQYDRPLWVFINGVPVLWGSTAQRYNWTATADLTLFYNLFKDEVTVTLILPNWVVPRIGVTGRFLLNMTLLFYPGEKPDVPNVIVPLWMGTWMEGLAVARPTLDKPNVTAPVTVPENVVKAKLLMFTEGLVYDEFWYYYGACYREVKVYFDDKLVALIHPYHYIYTGGLMPFLWRPLPAVRTYATEPVIVDVTGLLPLIVGVHNVTVEVTNIFSRSRWVIGGVLLLWTTTEPVKMELKYYNYTTTTNVEEETYETFALYRVSTTFNLKGASTITIGDKQILATTLLFSTLDVVRTYNDVWDNITLIEYRLSTTVEDVFKDEMRVGRYKWTNEWIGPLSVDYGFVVIPEGDISQASVQNPVPATFSIIVSVMQGLSTTTRIVTPAGLEVEVKATSLKESVDADNVLSGRLIFISPTAAVITSITDVYASTLKTVIGLILGEDYTWIYSRGTFALTTMREWYKIINDFLKIKEI